MAPYRPPPHVLLISSTAPPQPQTSFLSLPWQNYAMDVLFHEVDKCVSGEEEEMINVGNKINIPICPNRVETHCSFHVLCCPSSFSSSPSSSSPSPHVYTSLQSISCPPPETQVVTRPSTTPPSRASRGRPAFSSEIQPFFFSNYYYGLCELTQKSRLSSITIEWVNKYFVFFQWHCIFFGFSDKWTGFAKKLKEYRYLSIRHFVQKMWGLASPICKSYKSVTNVTNVLEMWN